MKGQPSKNGKYKHWVNVHVTGAKKGVCVNWEHVTDWNEDGIIEEENTGEDSVDEHDVDVEDQEALD